MIKVDKTVVGQYLPDYERPKAKEPEQRPAETDSVKISEEGKRRHILGHVLARISEPGNRTRE